MRLRVFALLLTGPSKPDAIIEPAGHSYLVFGPTDTGKSYIEECIAYCLGGDSHPRNIGYSEGYTCAALQVYGPDNSRFTFFRSLVDSGESIYDGFYSVPPQSEIPPLLQDVASILAMWGMATDKKILVKSGVLGNLAASDLRRLSMFDEIRTLDKVSLVGKDKLFKTRNRASVALAITGVDDSGITLAVKTDDRNIAKGHVQAIEEELKVLEGDIPQGWTVQECLDGLASITNEIHRVGVFLRSNARELSELKSDLEDYYEEMRLVQLESTNVLEAKDRFELLDKKYDNDIQRLSTLISASEIIETFEPKPCPLCRTDLSHQLTHDNSERSQPLRDAAYAEIIKVTGLREGLKVAISDVNDDAEYWLSRIKNLNVDISYNLASQQLLLNPEAPNLEPEYLESLVQRRTDLVLAERNFERIKILSARVVSLRAKAKRQKQTVSRDFSSSSVELCRRVFELLLDWAVPAVESVFFDEESADIYINNRNRVSYGKGKRGIFLTALVVAMMERALAEGNPHLGLIVIDSPVVTYKDPKHGTQDPEEALDVNVKDRFYSWLADRSEPGQIIVLENEEPDAEVQRRLFHEEFVGLGKAEGRRGFFPA